ncbi:hypothetical protein F4819DRAFT_167274 [Hypoxylon fuscum]|nr:hypothetical protein F4819DRAFT_167274 [Hypoxylon fuscum]
MLDLQKVLPYEGMMYQQRFDRKDLDPKILDVMTKAGFVSTKRRASSLKESKKAVDQELAEIFTTGLKTSITKKLKAGSYGATCFTAALRSSVHWAKNLLKPDWFRFCLFLVAARQACVNNPGHSSNTAKLSATAKSIDKFLLKVGQRWNPTNSNVKFTRTSDHVKSTRTTESNSNSFDMDGVTEALDDVRKVLTEDMELALLEDALFEEKDVGEAQEGIKGLHIDPYDSYDDDELLDLEW